jgi:hypothetical protein
MLPEAGRTASATTVGDVVGAGATPASAAATLAMVETRSPPGDPRIEPATHSSGSNTTSTTDPCANASLEAPADAAGRVWLATHNPGGTSSGGTSGSTGGCGTGSTGGKSLPRVSGLPWSSGVTSYKSDFDKWRSRPSDVYTQWTPHGTWDEAISSIGWWKKFASMPGRLSLGLPMLAKDTRGRFDSCNRGVFDAKVREIGRRLQAYGLGDSVIRLGWEMNQSTYPWGVPPDQKAAYKSCFQRQVGILRSQAPSLLIEWTPAKGTKYNYDVREIYPGNAYVDIIGVDYYDGWDATKDQTAWDKMYKKSHYGGPHGLGTWLAFAKSQGKRLAVPEWGVCEACSDPAQTDNPFYIRKMFEFFKANASSIAYETYFNSSTVYKGARFRIYPTYDNPKAAAEYNKLW